jgi:MoaA/NifB/PqqE/SkfB family radical SAM enzyme
MYFLETLSMIDFELSSHCNSKCPQCPRYDMQGYVHDNLKVTHLDLKLIKKIPLDKMPNLKKVKFCGNFGDPLMHPALDEIISFFKNQHISISTNASLRSTEWWAKLGTKKNIVVTFCIDGLGVEHELYRRNTSYEKIIKNAEAFIRSGGTALWQFIVFKHNEHQTADAKKISKKMGFREINFLYSDRFDTSNKWKVYDEGKYLYDLEESSHQITLRESLGAPEGEKYWKSLYKNKGEITCLWSQEKKIYIHSDGTVYPCCMLGSIQAGDKIQKLLYKKIVKDFTNIDLHHHDLQQILVSDVFKKNLPDSFNANPFQHPVCIEYCNKVTGKTYYTKI